MITSPLPIALVNADVASSTGRIGVGEAETSLDPAVSVLAGVGVLRTRSRSDVIVKSGEILSSGLEIAGTTRSGEEDSSRGAENTGDD